MDRCMRSWITQRRKIVINNFGTRWRCDLKTITREQIRPLTKHFDRPRWCGTCRLKGGETLFDSETLLNDTINRSVPSLIMMATTWKRALENNEAQRGALCFMGPFISAFTAFVAFCKYTDASVTRARFFECCRHRRFASRPTLLSSSAPVP